MDIDEKPLVVQLNWNKDDREGRFVLKNENDALPPKVGSLRVPYWPRPMLAVSHADHIPGPGLTMMNDRFTIMGGLH